MLCAGLLLAPLGGELLHLKQAASQVGALCGEAVAVAAMVHQAGGAQLFQAGVERVGCDAAHHEGAVVNGLGAVEGTLFASKALANDACFGIDPHLGRGGHEAMMIMMSIVGGGSSSS